MLTLLYDYKTQTQLWYYVEGVNGSQLLLDDQAKQIELEYNLLGNGTIKTSHLPHPEWFYKTDELQTLRHFNKLLIKLTAPWILLTFILLSIQLRLLKWKLELEHR